MLLFCIYSPSLKIIFIGLRTSHLAIKNTSSVRIKGLYASCIHHIITTNCIFCLWPLPWVILSPQNSLCHHDDKLFDVLVHFNCSVYNLKPYMLPLFKLYSYSSTKFLLAVLWCSSLWYSNTSYMFMYFSGKQWVVFTSILWVGIHIHIN